MEAVDELMTPGCAQCALKHLSAAVAEIVGGMRQTGGTRADVLKARAFVNLVEAHEGYASHYEYAIGLLVSAEESLVATGNADEARSVRKLRVAVMNGEPDSLMDLRVECLSFMAAAHVEEAARELPELCDRFDMRTPSCDQAGVDGLVKAAEWIRENYFTAPGEPEKGGEDTMANTKKAAPAAKAACKGGKAATKAACKGGKAACKGGKSCKK